MKFSSSSCVGFFFFFIIEVVHPTAAGAQQQQRRDRWGISLRRPFKGITSKLTRTMLSSSPTINQQRREQMRYVNLSEQQGVPPREYSSSSHSIISAALRDLYKINGNRLLADSPGIGSGGHLMFLDEEENRKRQRLGAEVKKTRGAAAAADRHSFLVATSVVPDVNTIYSRVPTVSLYETPIFEQDSYLEALQLSRLPCQSLEHPYDCNDSTMLFRQSPENNEAPASKKLLATIRVLINFHERYPHLNALI